MIIKMLRELRRRIYEHGEKLELPNEELENIKNQS